MPNDSKKDKKDLNVKLISREPSVVADGHSLARHPGGLYELNFFQIFNKDEDQLEIGVVASVRMPMKQLESIKDSIQSFLEKNQAADNNNSK
jgi:hypothetical protein